MVIGAEMRIDRSQVFGAPRRGAAELSLARLFVDAREAVADVAPGVRALVLLLCATGFWITTSLISVYQQAFKIGL
ncbi:Protein of unknown function [Gryllus bimaculatus]|nr:Protein of unknown function [Gryllus bimaculatus]